MPLPGGPADKAGNRYEAWWTVFCMSRVLSGKYDSIRLEPPGPEGQGVEFWLRRGDVREYHQVKRRGARSGQWTLRELNVQGILPTFRNHLADANAECVFVSIQGADTLRELAERARAAAGYAEFEREFAKGEWGASFSTLTGYWPGCAPREVFSLLKRIHVRTNDEETLRLLPELELASLVDGNANNASDILFAYALESVHQELDSTCIRNYLSNRGFNRPSWADPQALTDVVEAANKRYLTLLNRELIQGKLIHRDESKRVLAALRDNAAKRGVILTGAAGVGKSTVLLEVIKRLQQQGVLVLGLRVDRLEPTQLPDEVGRQLGLPTSPVSTLAAQAKGRPCVLVLDQLDAVSLISGRNPSFFECFDEMVREALTQPNMSLLIACRKFDFDNDHRLRRLGGRDHEFEMVAVGLLSNDIVRQTVEAMGLDVTGLSDRQIDLLSLPFHLKLLADVADEGATVALGFQTANDLYNLYWKRKQALLKQRLGRPVAWTAVIDELCEYMNERRILSVPAAFLDAHSSDVQAMASEHVLVVDDKRIAFFHEGFFDYAFARRFAARDSDLVGLLLSGEQHLFRRAQVRQILLHERESDNQRYLENVRTLLMSENIRFHIKQVVFALLSQFADPTEKEWRILEILLEDSDYPHRNEIWLAVRTSPWFRLIDSIGVIANWLGQDENDTVDQTVKLLYGVQGDAPDRVAELVEPYIGESEEWRKRHRYLVQFAELEASRRFFDLFLRLIERGDLDGMGLTRGDDFLSILYELAKSRPDWCCEAIRNYLTRCLKLAQEQGESSPFNDVGILCHSQVSEKVLIGSAQNAPEAFIEYLLPFVLQIIELNAIREGDTPWKDTVWRWRHRDDGYNVDHHLLRGAEEALRKLAREMPDEFIRLAEPLHESKYETVQFLLMRAYAANGERFADESIDYLCELPGRLDCGYLDSPRGASHELIDAATPYCSNDRLARLDVLLLDYYPKWERTANGGARRGLTQFELLIAINKPRRSASVKARIGEWQRKFRADTPPEPPHGGISWVGSPIPTHAAEKMTDDQWLNALDRYASDRDHEWRDGQPVGGPDQLSQMLESQVRKEPLRFARLVLEFPDDANPTYFSAVLGGLDSFSADAKALFEACRRCHRLAIRPVGSAFCRLVEERPEFGWPVDLLNAVAWYPTEDPDPDCEQWRTEAASGQYFYDGDIYMAGINCVRGAAAGTVRALLFADKDRIQQFQPTLQRMVRDPSIAVRSCVATSLLPVLNFDRDLAVQIFLELCDTEEVLLKTPHIEKFMQYALVTHFEQLRPIVERMLCSSESEVAQIGARRACVASLDYEAAVELVEECLVGSVPLRMGVAQVFAGNFGMARFRSLCQERLVGLFDDPSKKVQAAAAECFDHLDGDALGEVTVLVNQFLDSAAAEGSLEHVIRALKETTARLPDVTISVCKRFVEFAGSAGGDIRTRASYDANQLSELIIRAYHQAADEVVSTQCLDMIDDLLEVKSYGLQSALGEFDR